MPSSIQINEGPHGLGSIDVYEPNNEDTGYVLPFWIVPQYDSSILRINDANGEKAADAYFTGPEEERKQAEQWLLDFTCISADGR